MKMEFFCSWEKKIRSTENHVRPNRDESDYVLILTVGVDLESEQTIRYRCIKWLDIESCRIWSVASRSRRVMIILNKLFIRQLESNSLYSILQINDTKSTRNGRCGLRSSVIWLFEIPKSDGGRCFCYVLGRNDTLCASWQWSVSFSTGLWEIQLSINSNSISRSLDEMILYQNQYF
jgi:hypothetical protein